MANRYPVGTILWVKDVPSADGRDCKDRGVVLIEGCDTAADAEFVGVAVTSRFDRPPPGDHVPLPFGTHGRCETGLRTESCAVCSWVVILPVGDILRRHGNTPPVPLKAILEGVAPHL